MIADDTFRSQVKARDGAQCIYAEKRWIAHATVSITSFTDAHLMFRVHTLDTPGFTPPDETTWEAGVALKELRFSPECWLGSPWVAWIVAFAPDVITALTTLAQELKDQPVEQRAMALRSRLAELLWPEMFRPDE